MNRFDALEDALRLACPGLEVRRNEPMSRHTSFRIGGPVAVMALPKGEGQLLTALQVARELDITPVPLGNGSNLLCSDGPMEQFVICLLDGLDELTLLPEHRVRCGAGVLLSRLAAFAQKHALTGLEFASGIPGTLGGGAVMNAGAYGGELKDVLTETRCVTLEGEIQTFRGEEQGFGYRRSAFTGGDKIVLSGLLQLAPGDGDAIKARMDTLNQRRRSKQPLEYPSAGSTFKRPVGGFAAALIQQCGLKGLTVGGAQVSEKHSGFIINKGGATCADVLALARQVHDIVQAETGISLELEIKQLT
ncbi:MAG: UDP-N-acetylmuramate dehydrogenase [Clostridiales bacterium]|nr:UDP-N-acetylmuramate dehydrogenase [Clostridiales bacterium]